MVEWKRKNVFVSEIRRFLKRFRIVEVKTEASLECQEIQNATGGKEWIPTGRSVVNLRVVGYWRQK